MLGLIKLVNVIDKKMSALHIEKNLCTKILSPKSSCQSCVEVCPKESIVFYKDNLEIQDSCVDCGLCTAVCPTSAITFLKPSLNGIVSDIINKCQQNEHVYLYCGKKDIPEKDTAAIRLPCLGIIPREAWMKLICQCTNFSIYDDGSCGSCEILKGESVWRHELESGEKMAGKKVQVTSKIIPQQKKVEYDQSRRAFFQILFKEIKQTNTILIKDSLVNPKMETYQDKLKEDSYTFLKRQLNEISTSVVEKITNEPVHPYMQKRLYFLEELKNNKTMQNNHDFKLPNVLTGCNLCGACAVLCPTNALTKEQTNGMMGLTLQPYRCVDCGLCEEICYLNQIQMKHELNSSFLTNKKVLIEESESV